MSDGVAVGGIPDGWREQSTQRQLTEALAEHAPSLHRAWDRHLGMGKGKGKGVLPQRVKGRRGSLPDSPRWIHSPEGRRPRA